jgi:hypothetical protein
VGGAAIGYGGVATYKKTSGKLLRAMERGSINLGMQFAHTKRKDFKETYLNNPLGVIGLVTSSYLPAFGSDWLANEVVESVQSQIPQSFFDLSKYKYFISYGVEYYVDVSVRGHLLNKSFPDKKDNKWVKKISLIGYKSYFYGFIF